MDDRLAFRLALIGFNWWKSVSAPVRTMTILPESPLFNFFSGVVTKQQTFINFKNGIWGPSTSARNPDVAECVMALRGTNTSTDKYKTFHASSSGEHNLATNSEWGWGGASREHDSAQQCSCKSALYVLRGVQTF